MFLEKAASQKTFVKTSNAEKTAIAMKENVFVMQDLRETQILAVLK